MSVAPWSTQPVTGAQHRVWMAEERRNAGWPTWVLAAMHLHRKDLLDEALRYDLSPVIVMPPSASWESIPD